MLFSIIIPVYNAERYLKESLESLRAQTFDDWEAICVDDGSWDGSARILDDYARNDLRIRVIHQRNGGASAARNTALQLAHGDWIGFMDSDDLLENDWLRRVADELKERAVDLVRCDFKWMFDSQGGRIVEHGKKRKLVLLNQNEVMKRLWTNWPRVAMVWLCFYRREMILLSGVRFDLRCSPVEDMVFNLKLLPYIGSMCQIENNGYLYRQCVDSVRSVMRTYKATEGILLAGLDAYEGQRRRLAKQELFPAVFKQMFMIVWGNVGCWLFSRPEKEAKLKANVRRLCFQVLGPCVKDRFSAYGEGVQCIILRGLTLLCLNIFAHQLYRRCFKVAWNARDLMRRVKKRVSLKK